MQTRRPQKRTLRPSVFAAVMVGAFLLSTPEPLQAQSWLEGAQNLLNKSLGGDTGSSIVGLSDTEIADGLREALSIGSETVTSSLGVADGFNEDPVVRIPLPDSLRTVQTALSTAGLGALGEDVELRMNRAAEAAMGDVSEVLLTAIQSMTLEDAKTLLNGDDTSATRFLQKTAGIDIQNKIQPIVEASLAEVGALRALDVMLADYKKLPFVPDVSADLTAHATKLAYDGVFHYIAEEEKAIRENPAKRTTELLQKVFAQ